MTWTWLNQLFGIQEVLPSYWGKEDRQLYQQLIDNSYNKEQAKKLVEEELKSRKNLDAQYHKIRKLNEQERQNFNDRFQG